MNDRVIMPKMMFDAIESAGPGVPVCSLMDKILGVACQESPSPLREVVKRARPRLAYRTERQHVLSRDCTSFPPQSMT